MSSISSFRPAPAGAALLASVLAGAMLPSSARADAVADAAPDNDIVVTAQNPNTNPYADPNAPYKIDRSANGRFTEPLADTPKSITVIPKEVMQDIGANSLRDLVRTQPGVTLGTGEGGNAYGDRIFIRGFEARNDVYIDNMRDPGVGSREIFAVEQIEVVKGPSSAFSGRGTTGGALSLVSKQPIDRDFVVVEGLGGLPDLQRVTADVNYRVGDRLTVRVNGLFHREKVAGRDFVNNKRYGVQAALAWRATPTLTIALDHYHLDSDGMPDFGLPFDARTQEPFKVNRSNFYGVLARDFIENNADVTTGLLTWKPVEKLTISSRTRYGRTRNSYVASAPENPSLALQRVSANPKNRNALTSYIANQTEARATIGDGPVVQNVVIGGEFSRETVTNRPYVFNSEVIGTIVNPVVPVFQNLFFPNARVAFPFPRALTGTRTVTRTESYAVYALDTIKIGDKLQVLLGGRYDTYDITVTTIPSAAAPLTNDVGFFNWQASLVYKPVPPLTLYVSAASSSNPSGEQLDGGGLDYNGLAATTQNLEPERNKAYEAGVKWEPNPHLLITAAAFRVNKDNARTQVAPNLVALVGDQLLKGFEFGVAGNITPRWQVFGGYTYLDSEIRQSGVAAQVGSRFPNVAKHSASLLTTYAITDALVIGGQVTYNSEKFGGQISTTTARVPGWLRYDAVARFKVTDWAQVRLNVLNITDKVYFDTIYRSGTPFAYIAPGRSATLGVTLNF